MADSYCGKNCRFCVSRTEGKCIGCKPEVFVPLHESLYISGVENAEEKKQIIGESDITSASVPTTDETGTRFSSYCQIAICCRNKKIEGCNECLKSYACDKYMKKGIMNTIIDSQMDAWGMIDHGLKKAVPFLYILLFCFIPESIFSVITLTPGIPKFLILVASIFAGIRAYGYYRLRSFNNSFLTVTALTVAFIFSSLFLVFLDVIDYGVIGVVLTFAASLIKLASSVLCYKISFDAYGDLVSPVSPVLEHRWSKLWPLTVFLCILAFVIALINYKSWRLAGLIGGIEIAIALMNILTFILMIATINVCPKE